MISLFVVATNLFLKVDPKRIMSAEFRFIDDKKDQIRLIFKILQATTNQFFKDPLTIYSVFFNININSYITIIKQLNIKYNIYIRSTYIILFPNNKPKNATLF